MRKDQAVDMAEAGSTEVTPLLRVVNADATPEEIAAIVAVFAGLGSTSAPAPRKPRSEWASPARRVRPALTAGRGAWRASGLPF